MVIPCLTTPLGNQVLFFLFGGGAISGGTNHWIHGSQDCPGRRSRSKDSNNGEGDLEKKKQKGSKESKKKASTDIAHGICRG